MTSPERAVPVSCPCSPGWREGLIKIFVSTIDNAVNKSCNALLDTPSPKVKAGKSRLSRALAALPDDTPLRELLRDDRPAPDAELPRTGVSLAWERMLSRAFIRAPGYSTRCSTVITRDRHGWARFTESTWNEVGIETGRVVETFQINRA